MAKWSRWASASILAGTVVVLAPVRPALAAAGCSDLAPAMSDVVNCTTAGTDTIAVPNGAQVIKMSITGAGGGGGRASGGGAFGGKGVIAYGWVTLPPSTDHVGIVVGAGGAEGGADGAVHEAGGAGGGASAVVAYDGSVNLGVLAIAGGGGGGGGNDGGWNPANGGDAGLTGSDGLTGTFSSSTATGGGGGNGAAGGAGGTATDASPVNGGAGPNALPGVVAAGGAGAVIDSYPRGGGGGGGYAGGGGGSAFPWAAPGYYIGSGGGGGSSFADPTWFSAAQFAIPSSGPGIGGFPSAYVPGTGQDGVAVLRFEESTSPQVVSLSPDQGLPAGNTTVTINGHNLDEVTTAEIGGNTCTNVTPVSSTQMTCTVPANSVGPQNVTVTDPNQGPGTLADGYTYMGPPAPVSVSPPAGLLAGGGTLTVTGTNLDGTTAAVTVGGANCTPVTVVSPTSWTCPLPTGSAGADDVVVTNAWGTETLTGVYTYRPQPQVTAVSPSTGLITGGGTITLTGTDFTGASLVTIGGQPCGPVLVASATSLTCTIPAVSSAAAADVAVTTVGGTGTLPGGYTYQALAVPPPVVVTPPPVVVTPTPTPTTPAPTAPAPTAPPTLDLAINVQVGAPVAGSTAKVSGGGLKPKSPYSLTMFSTPIPIASGWTTADGTFGTSFRLPPKVCTIGGLHRFVLSGIAPDGHRVSDTTWMVLDNTCKARDVNTVRPPTNAVPFGTYLFTYHSTQLSPDTKRALKAAYTALLNAKFVTIVGYTETDQKTPAAVRANKALSLRRAETVRAYLRSLGVKAPIAVVGAGGVNPVKGKPQRDNRRVVITVRY